MTWKTRIALIRDMPAGHGISYGRTFITPREMRVATLSSGYADGYPTPSFESRNFSSGPRTTLRAAGPCHDGFDDDRCFASGRRGRGDEVVLMGRQGDEEISATELAERAETITWEIMTRIGARVRRVYV